MALELYNPHPETVVRVKLTGKSFKPQYLTVCGKDAKATGLELLQMLKEVDHHLSLDYTTVQLRNAVGAVNKNAISFRVYGIAPLQVKDLIIAHLTM